MTDDIYLQQLRHTFKNKRILILGDSIMRGLYKDICCILNNNSRLLYDNELVHNHNNIHGNIFFGEKIDLFHFNRTDCIFNKEKRIYH